MYFYDHSPPHFHARYAGYKAIFSLGGDLMEGELPKRAMAIVIEWMHVRRVELERNWAKASAGQALEYIAPLE
jgi:hypothetical protein